MMKRSIEWLASFGFLGFCVLAASIVLVGCKPTPTSMATTESHDHHDHEHEAHGPHGGHVVHLEPSHMSAEWNHDDDAGKISVYVDDFVKAGKSVDGVKVELEVQGESKKEYVFTKNAEGVFELVSQELLTAIEVGSGDSAKVKATLMLDVAGQAETALMEHHEHHHH